jgi:hypothetical protein
MRPEAQGYVLKEYGSWSVLIVASLVGIAASRAFDWTVLPLCLALGLLVNSKQALMKRLRKADDRTSLLIFLGHIIIATVILIALFRDDIPRLLPLLIIPGAYLLSNKAAGEHFILTELLGFTLLSLAAVLVKFLLTNGLDVRLFVGAALYFTAGVFKVKAVLLRKMQDRIATVLYVLFAAYAYYRFHLAFIMLLPLLDNLVVAVTMYKVRLQTTGWIEVAKSLLFLGLFSYYY